MNKITHEMDAKDVVIAWTLFFVMFIIMLPLAALFGLVTGVRDFYREVFEV